MSKQEKLSIIEKIKTESKGLRGSIIESLQDELTGLIMHILKNVEMC